MSNFRILGREPTLWLQVINGAMALLISFGFAFLTDRRAGAITAFVAAVLAIANAWAVRPMAPALFQGAVQTALALVATFGLDLSQQQIGAIQLVVISVFAAWTRQSVTPVIDKAPTTPANGLVR